MDVIKPMVALLMMNIIVLIVWTVIGPLHRETVVVTKDPFDRNTETYGICSSDQGFIFLATLGTINFGCLLFAVLQAGVRGMHGNPANYYHSFMGPCT